MGVAARVVGVGVGVTVDVVLGAVVGGVVGGALGGDVRSAVGTFEQDATTRVIVIDADAMDRA
ncbi:MAG: hypothetical protein ACJ765_08630 [Chloroflexota bacterium]